MEIPKPHGGGVRLLGVPTVADRVAQTVVAMHLEERAEPRFHPDSYGYRPKKAAWDAVGVCRQRCWKKDWVIDLDVQKFFDSVPWDLIVKAVEAVTDTPWVLLYVKRWLAAPLQPQMAPLWSETKELRKGRRSRRSWRICSCILRSILGWPGYYPGVQFERYADDAVVHCVSQAAGRAGACRDRRADGARWAYGCTRTKRGSSTARTASAGETTSTPASPFSGSPSGHGGRKAAGTGGSSVGFLPAMSTEALKAKSTELRAMRIHRRTDLTLDDLARWLNPIVAGWMNYYGRFYRSAMNPLLLRVSCLPEALGCEKVPSAAGL